MNDNERLVYDYLVNNNIPTKGSEQEVISRILEKIEIHELILDDEGVKEILDNYGKEVTDPISSVNFQEDEY